MEPQIKALGDSVSGENLLPGSQYETFSLCSHLPEGKGASRLTDLHEFSKHIIPGGPTFMI